MFSKVSFSKKYYIIYKVYICIYIILYFDNNVIKNKEIQSVQQFLSDEHDVKSYINFLI